MYKALGWHQTVSDLTQTQHLTPQSLNSGRGHRGTWQGRMYRSCPSRFGTLYFCCSEASSKPSSVNRLLVERQVYISKIFVDGVVGHVSNFGFYLHLLPMLPVHKSATLSPP